MANYSIPMVVQPTIPAHAMTPIGRLLLTHIFDFDEDEDGFYFYAEESTADSVSTSAEEVRAALAESDGVACAAASFIREIFPDIETLEGDIDVDLSLRSWEWLFQDILRRTPELDHVVVYAAFTCSKMRPDGFGGMVVLITADAVLSKDTNQALDELLREAKSRRSASPQSNPD